MPENKTPISRIPKQQTPTQPRQGNLIPEFSFRKDLRALYITFWIFALTQMASLLIKFVPVEMQKAHAETFHVCNVIALGMILPLLGGVVEIALKKYRIPVGKKLRLFMEKIVSKMFLGYTVLMVIIILSLMANYVFLSGPDGTTDDYAKSQANALLLFFQFVFGGLITSLSMYADHKRSSIYAELEVMEKKG